MNRTRTRTRRPMIQKGGGYSFIKDFDIELPLTVDGYDYRNPSCTGTDDRGGLFLIYAEQGPRARSKYYYVDDQGRFIDEPFMTIDYTVTQTVAVRMPDGAQGLMVCSNMGKLHLYIAGSIQIWERAGYFTNMVRAKNNIYIKHGSGIYMVNLLNGDLVPMMDQIPRLRGSLMTGYAVTDRHIYFSYVEITGIYKIVEYDMRTGVTTIIRQERHAISFMHDGMAVNGGVVVNMIKNSAFNPPPGQPLCYRLVTPSRYWIVNPKERDHVTITKYRIVEDGKTSWSPFRNMGLTGPVAHPDPAPTD